MWGTGRASGNSGLEKLLEGRCVMDEGCNDARESVRIFGELAVGGEFRMFDRLGRRRGNRL